MARGDWLADPSQGGARAASRRAIPHRSRSVLPVLLVALGVSLSFITLQFTTGIDRDARQAAFENVAREIVEFVNQRVAGYTEVLHGFRGLFETGVAVQRREFHDYFESDGVATRLLGLEAIEFARLVPLAEKEAFEAEVRNDSSLVPGGYPDFSVWPEGEREEYFVVDYIEPFEGDERSFGFDLGSNESKLLAVEQSRDSGDPSATAPFTFVEETGGEAAILFLLAVYQKGLPTDTVSQRRAALQGLVTLVLSVKDMMEGVVAPVLEAVDLEIYDGGPSEDGVLPPTRAGLMFDGDGVVRGLDDHLRDGLHLDDYVAVGGRNWVLHFSSLQPSGSPASVFPFVIFAFGIGSSVLVGGILFVIWRSGDAAKTQARVTRAILHAIGEGVVVANREGRLTYFNPAAERLFGAGPKDVAASEWSETYGFYLPDGVTPCPSERLPLARALRGEEVDNTEEFVRRTDSPEGVVTSVTSRPVLDEDGAVIGAVSVSRDVTEQKRVEQALRRSEELLEKRSQISDVFLTYRDDKAYREALRVVLEAVGSRHGILGYINGDGALVSASMTKEVWSQCQMPDKNLVFPPEAWGGLWGLALKEKKTLVSNGGLHVPEGHIPVSNAIATPIMYQQDVIGILMVGNKRTEYGETDRETVETLANHMSSILYSRLQRDREERRRRLAEEALAQHSKELARSNADLEQFAYIASHDLQEPLRMVASYLQLLERRYDGKLDSDADEFIDYAVNGAKRMQDMINGLLAYSRVSTKGKEFEPVDCEKVFKEAVENLEIVIEDEGATITHGPLPVVLADRVQLLQLFQNLIGNGVKFRTKEPPHVHVSAEPDGGSWRFSFRDNGIGIEPEYTERVFEMFRRLHSRTEYPGTGIGLAVCRKIVERHGGRIWVESEPGKGTTFHFTLPADGGDES